MLFAGVLWVLLGLPFDVHSAYFAAVGLVRWLLPVGFVVLPVCGGAGAGGAGDGCGILSGVGRGVRFLGAMLKRGKVSASGGWRQAVSGDDAGGAGDAVGWAVNSARCGAMLGRDAKPKDVKAITNITLPSNIGREHCAVANLSALVTQLCRIG